MKSIQVLIPTMDLVEPSALLQKMNISSNFIIGNQCNRTEDKEISYNEHYGLCLSRKTKGVGNNRNLIMQYSTADYCIMADDDMRFYDNYQEVVKSYFEMYPNADVLIFNIDEANNSLRRINSKVRKINIFNYMNYGAARFVFRRKAISYNGIFFNTNFGGGTKHLCGEDSLFLRECLRKELTVYTVPCSIAVLTNERESTWFKGFNAEYFFDKGVFLSLAHPHLCYIFALFLSFRFQRSTNAFPWLQLLRIMINGVRYEKNKKYLK